MTIELTTPTVDGPGEALAALRERQDGAAPMRPHPAPSVACLPPHKEPGHSQARLETAGLLVGGAALRRQIGQLTSLTRRVRVGWPAMAWFTGHPIGCRPAVHLGRSAVTAVDDCRRRLGRRSHRRPGCCQAKAHRPASMPLLVRAGG
jgi:hypothetical protein